MVTELSHFNLNVAFLNFDLKVNPSSANCCQYCKIWKINMLNSTHVYYLTLTPKKGPNGHNPPKTIKKQRVQGTQTKEKQKTT